MAEPQAQAQEQAQPSKPKPCCVCKEEKQTRDECILINGQDGGQCDSLIDQYKTCMKGFGFTI
jgi:cytochrome c oxidase assembly protein subunit 17